LRGPPAGLSRFRIGGGQLESVKEDLVPLQDLNKDSVFIISVVRDRSLVSATSTSTGP
jgi:hypothetical protein